MSNKFAAITDSIGDISFTDSYAITKQFKTDSEFSQHIELEAMQSGETIIDTILAYCEKNDIDEELIAKLLTGSIKEKIRYEALELKLIGVSEDGVLEI